MKGVKSPPSSRLDSARLEIFTPGSRLVINPYKWLQADRADHRLLLDEAPGLNEGASRSRLEGCPLLAAFQAALPDAEMTSADKTTPR